MGEMFNKVFDHFYWGCHVVKEATRQMMAELDRIGINYDKRTVRKKRRIDKALGRFELFWYLKVTEKEVDRKFVSIANYQGKPGRSGVVVPELRCLAREQEKNKINGSPSSQSQQNYQYGRLQRNQ